MSRSESQTDLSNLDEIRKFAQKSLEFDTYISCSCLFKFNQTLLLQAVVDCWRKNNHKGQIVVLGSTADTPVKGTEWLYPIEKKALKSYCRNLSFAALGGHGKPPAGYRITYLSPGYLDTPDANEKHPSVMKLELSYIAGMIEWILQQPLTVNISEISLDPIQEK
jgi:NADP-dependent 3-hydroxy acid dehydrogenase YdfG